MLCSVVINFCNFFRNHLGTVHFTVFSFFSISGVALCRMTSFEDVHSSGETDFNEDLRELTLDSIISFHSSRTKFSGDGSFSFKWRLTDLAPAENPSCFSCTTP